MDAFLANAENLLRTARIAARLSPDASDVSVFIGESGQVDVVTGGSGSLGAMADHFGAHIAYRVTQAGGSRVEGLQGSRRCLVGPQPSKVGWLKDTPRYQLG